MTEGSTKKNRKEKGIKTKLDTRDVVIMLHRYSARIEYETRVSSKRKEKKKKKEKKGKASDVNVCDIKIK